MQFAVGLPTAADSWRLAERAESLGFAAAWFYDTQMLNADCFAAMAAAAMKTSRIRLGTGVLVPSNRIAPVTANALATLNALAPGRIDFGIGSGFTARRAMGFGPVPLAEMRRYIETVEALIAGETVDFTDGRASRRIRFLNPELGCINTSDPIRLHVSAMGPKARALCAGLGAGWLNFMTGMAPALGVAGAMRRDWQAAGRDLADLSATGFTVGCVLQQGEPADSPRALAQAGPMAAVYLHNLVEAEALGRPAGRLPPAHQAALERYRALYRSYPAEERHLRLHRGHMMFLREDEAPLIDADLVRDTSFTGTAEEIRANVEALAAAGYTQLAVQITPGQEDALDDWARAFGLT